MSNSPDTDIADDTTALVDPAPSQLSNSKSKKWSTFPQKLGLWVAESDFGLAPAVARSLEENVASELTGYLPGWAVGDLSESAAGFMQRHYEWHVAPGAIRPVADVLAALEYVIREFTRPGSAVVVPTPAYMPFLTVPKYLGREIIEVPLVRDAAGAWVHDLERIETALRARAGLVLLCNPHNPLGRVFEREELAGLAELVGRFDARVFADEIHAPIRYDDKPHIPFASISEQTAQFSITATSTSKAFNTPGLKCGQIILTADSDRRRWSEMGWFAEHGAGTLGATAATAAYRDGDEWLARFNAALARNRELVTDLLHDQLPLSDFTAPEGTYLAWVDLSSYRRKNSDSTASRGGAAQSKNQCWGKYLRDHAKIAVIAGSDCGGAGAGHIRLNFATSSEILRAAIGRLRAAIE